LFVTDSSKLYGLLHIIGLESYSRMLQDPDFAEVLRTTVLFTVASGGLSFVAGLGLTLLLSRPFAGRGTLAVVAFLPWVFPPVVAATFGRLALFGGVGPVGNAAGAASSAYPHLETTVRLGCLQGEVDTRDVRNHGRKLQANPQIRWHPGLPS